HTLSRARNSSHQPIFVVSIRSSCLVLAPTLLKRPWRRLLQQSRKQTLKMIPQLRGSTSISSCCLVHNKLPRDVRMLSVSEAGVRRPCPRETPLPNRLYHKGLAMWRSSSIPRIYLSRPLPTFRRNP